MTLTDLSNQLRKAMPFLIAGFVLVVVVISVLSSYLTSLKNRPAPIVFDKKFGPILKIELQNKLDYPDSPRFILDNIEGRPITATQAAEIFFLPKPRTKFGYLENMYLMAKSVGFETTVTTPKIENTTGTFEDSDKSLTIDIQTQNFTFKRKFQSSPVLFETSKLPSESKIIEEAKAFLQKMGRYPQDLAKGTDHIVYMKYATDTDTFEVVSNPNKANVVEVDFFRPDIDDIKMVSPKYFTSQNFVAFTFPGEQPEVIKAAVQFFDRDLSNTGIYPVKTGDEAWKELQNKKGIIVANQNPTSTIKVTRMMYGYLDPDIYQPYMQPVYIFLGDNNFVAYVSALKNDDLTTSSPTPKE